MRRLLCLVLTVALQGAACAPGAVGVTSRAPLAPPPALAPPPDTPAPAPAPGDALGPPDATEPGQPPEPEGSTSAVRGGVKSNDTVLFLAGKTGASGCAALQPLFLELLDSAGTQDAMVRRLTAAAVITHGLAAAAVVLPQASAPPPLLPAALAGVFSRNQLCWYTPAPKNGTDEVGLQLAGFQLSAILANDDLAYGVIASLGRPQGVDMQSFLAGAGIPCLSVLTASTLAEAQTSPSVYTLSCDGKAAVANSRRQFAVPALCCSFSPRPPRRVAPPRPPPRPPQPPSPPPAVPPAPPRPPFAPRVKRFRPPAPPTPPPKPALEYPPVVPQLMFDVFAPPERLSCPRLISALNTLALPYGLNNGTYTCESKAAEFPVQPGGWEGPYVTATASWTQRTYQKAFRRLLEVISSSVEVFVSLSQIPCGTEVRPTLRGPNGAIKHTAAYGCSTMDLDYQAALNQTGLALVLKSFFCCKPPPPPLLPSPPPRPPSPPEPSEPGLPPPPYGPSTPPGTPTAGLDPVPAPRRPAPAPMPAPGLPWPVPAPALPPQSPPPPPGMAGGGLPPGDAAAPPSVPGAVGSPPKPAGRFKRSPPPPSNPPVPEPMAADSVPPHPQPIVVPVVIERAHGPTKGAFAAIGALAAAAIVSTATVIWFVARRRALQRSRSKAGSGGGGGGDAGSVSSGGSSSCAERGTVPLPALHGLEVGLKDGIHNPLHLSADPWAGIQPYYPPGAGEPIARVVVTAADASPRKLPYRASGGTTTENPSAFGPFPTDGGWAVGLPWAGTTAGEDGHHGSGALASSGQDDDALCSVGVVLNVAAAPGFRADTTGTGGLPGCGLAPPAVSSASMASDIFNGMNVFKDAARDFSLSTATSAAQTATSVAAQQQRAPLTYATPQHLTPRLDMSLQRQTGHQPPIVSLQDLFNQSPLAGAILSTPPASGGGAPPTLQPTPASADAAGGDGGGSTWSSPLLAHSVSVGAVPYGHSRPGEGSYQQQQLQGNERAHSVVARQHSESAATLQRLSRQLAASLAQLQEPQRAATGAGGDVSSSSSNSLDAGPRCGGWRTAHGPAGGVAAHSPGPIGAGLAQPGNIGSGSGSGRSSSAEAWPPSSRDPLVSSATSPGTTSSGALSSLRPLLSTTTHTATTSNSAGAAAAPAPGGSELSALAAHQARQERQPPLANAWAHYASKMRSKAAAAAAPAEGPALHSSSSPAAPPPQQLQGGPGHGRTHTHTHTQHDGRQQQQQQQAPVGGGGHRRNGSSSMVQQGDAGPLDLDPDLEINPRDIKIQTDGLLGQGAFGSVYRGSYRGQPVAIKVLHHLHLAAAGGGGGVQQKDIESFRHELAILSRLTHTNIVRVLGGCANAHHPFLVMELMPNCLHNVIHGSPGRMSLRRAVQIGRDVAAGLAHLHPGIVHRDLKPANILCDSAGVAKISDFGLARTKLKNYISTQQPDAGSVAYMAPECMQAGKLSAKCDVYSFGVLLWEVLMQEVPWAGDSSVAIIYRVAVHRMHPAVPSDPAICPPRLAQLLEACMAYTPADRPDMSYVLATLEDMVTQLDGRQ